MSRRLAASAASSRVLAAPAAAGFAGFEVLAIDNPFWHFYRLRG